MRDKVIEIEDCDYNKLIVTIEREDVGTPPSLSDKIKCKIFRHKYIEFGGLMAEISSDIDEIDEQIGTISIAGQSVEVCQRCWNVKTHGCHMI